MWQKCNVFLTPNLYSRELLLTVFTKHRNYDIKNNFCLQNKDDNHIEICPLLGLKQTKYHNKGGKNLLYSLHSILLKNVAPKIPGCILRDALLLLQRCYSKT